MTVPHGPVLLTIQRARETSAVTHQLVWEYQKEQLSGIKNQKSEVESLSSVKKIRNLPMMTSAIAHDFIAEENIWGIGGKKSFIPKLGDKIWESSKESIFDAYRVVLYFIYTRWYLSWRMILLQHPDIV